MNNIILKTTMVCLFIISLMLIVSNNTISSVYAEGKYILPKDSSYFKEGIDNADIIGKPADDEITADIADTWEVVFEVFGNIVNFILILIPSIAMLMIIYGGFKYVQGSFDGKSEGKQIIQYAIMGFVLAMLAYVISSLILAAIIGSTGN